MTTQRRGAARKTHVLKTWPEYLDAVIRGVKTFEVRRDDRQFEVGDTLVLHEWEPLLGAWGKREISCTVTFLLRGGRFGVMSGYVVMGMSLIADALDRSPYDVGECVGCGEAVVCLPDGMPRCAECEKQAEG